MLDADTYSTTDQLLQAKHEELQKRSSSAAWLCDDHV
jgi:hypothetical protein